MSSPPRPSNIMCSKMNTIRDIEPYLIFEFFRQHTVVVVGSMLPEIFVVCETLQRGNAARRFPRGHPQPRGAHHPRRHLLEFFGGVSRLVQRHDSYHLLCVRNKNVLILCNAMDRKINTPVLATGLNVGLLGPPSLVRVPEDPADPSVMVRPGRLEPVRDWGLDEDALEVLPGCTEVVPAPAVVLPSRRGSSSPTSRGSPSSPRANPMVVAPRAKRGGGTFWVVSMMMERVGEMGKMKLRRR